MGNSVLNKKIINFQNTYAEKIITFFLAIFMVLSLLPLDDYGKKINDYTLDYTNIEACEANIFYATSSYTQQKIEYKVIVNYDLDIIPNLKNLKCLNKINNIEELDDLFQITTSRSKPLEYLILSSLFILLLIAKNLKIAKYLLIIFFIFINYSYYNFNNFNVNFMLNSLFFVLLVFSESPQLKQKKIFQIPLFLSLFMSHFYSHFRFNSSDEVYYIGQNFASSSEFSAYFKQDHMETFNNLILLFVNIFKNDFFISLKTLQALFFCLIVVGFKNIFKLSNYSILLFLILIFRLQGIFPTHWLIYNITPAGICNLLILTAFLLFFKSKYFYTTLLLITATYFHFAYVLMISPLFIYLFTKRLGIKKTFSFFSLYVFGSIYSLVRIVTENLDQRISNLNDVLNYYITIRHPQNMPFDLSSEYYLKPIIPLFRKGFIYIIIGLIILIIIKRFQKNIDVFYVDFIIFSYVVFIFYMILLYFFPISYFALLVPIRLNVFIVFFSLLIIIKSLELTAIAHISDKKSELFVIVFIILYITPFSLDFYNPINSVTVQNNLSIDFIYEEKEKNQLIKKIDEYKNESIFITPVGDSVSSRDFFDTLELSTQKPGYGVFKFVPHQINLIPEWILRITKIQTFFSGDCNALNEIKPFYFILNKENADLNKCGTLEYENQKYQIYIYK